MRAFEGIRILDFTHVFAGPFATFQLGVMGAEVIKVEPTDTPDMMRDCGANADLNKLGIGLSYQVNNQGKKAIALNLKHPEGVNITRQLIATADVLVENYANGLDDLGLGPDTAMGINPQLIYCNMSGFGSNNPFEGRPAYDTVIQAASGMMSVNGEADQPKLRVGPPLIDYGTGAQTAFAISAALFQRSQTGKGQVIEVNMLDAAFMMMSPMLADASYNGQTDARFGNIHPNLPGYSTFPCLDTDIMVGAFTIAQNSKLFNALNLSDKLALPEPLNAAWIKQHNARLRALMLPIFASRTANEWETILNQHDVPAARVRDMYEMLVEEQPHRSNSSQFQRVPESEMTAPIAAFKYAESGPVFNPRCAKHGEDTAEVLTELGIGPQQFAALQQSGAVK